MMSIPRPEYPRPQFVRAAWQNLNGPWRFSFDAPALDRTIQVPFAYQTALSGIHDTSFHREVWYEREFIPDRADGRLLLHFGAVDYRCRVWVNGAFVGGHEGGSASFTLDVTDAVHPGENTLRVQAIDEPSDLGQPRGKQYWKEEPHGIFYTPTTGIWQTVWLEPVPGSRVERVDITPDFDEGAVA